MLSLELEAEPTVTNKLPDYFFSDRRMASSLASSINVFFLLGWSMIISQKKPSSPYPFSLEDKGEKELSHLAAELKPSRKFSPISFLTIPIWLTAYFLARGAINRQSIFS